MDFVQVFQSHLDFLIIETTISVNGSLLIISMLRDFYSTPNDTNLSYQDSFSINLFRLNYRITNSTLFFRDFFPTSVSHSHYQTGKSNLFFRDISPTTLYNSDYEINNTNLSSRDSFPIILSHSD